MRPRPAPNPWDALARTCLADVVSPLHDSVSHPLLPALARIPDRPKRVAADLGCGTGTLLPRLARSFGRVVALDSSPVMLELARRRVERLPVAARLKVELHLRSLAALAPFRGGLDVVITQNSVVMPEPDAIRRALRSIARSLAPEGVYFGVFPALESLAAEVRFVFDHARRAGRSPAAARIRAARQLRLDRVDFALGTYRTRFMLQKYYTEHELRGYLAAAGLRPVLVDRVIYRRGVTFNYSRQLPPGRPRVWHWFVACGR